MRNNVEDKIDLYSGVITACRGMRYKVTETWCPGRDGLIAEATEAASDLAEFVLDLSSNLRAVDQFIKKNSNGNQSYSVGRNPDLIARGVVFSIKGNNFEGEFNSLLRSENGISGIEAIDGKTVFSPFSDFLLVAIASRVFSSQGYKFNVVPVVVSTQKEECVFGKSKVLRDGNCSVAVVVDKRYRGETTRKIQRAIKSKNGSLNVIND